MANDDAGRAERSWPDVFRKLMERLEGAVPLPPSSSVVRSLGARSPLAPSLGDVLKPEPATDLLETPQSIFVTLEVPGVSRDEIDLRATDGTLHVSARGATRQFDKEIVLPARVRVGSIRATYRNGVLDVVLEKEDPKSAREVSTRGEGN